MDKHKDKTIKSKKIVDNNKDKNKINKDHEDYGYDFVPSLNEWLNIDEQRERTNELEEI